ncbi:MAG: hypothetical protein J6Y65_03690, partial [Eggerthellaceae bacterium]|nr:hypothetical protein [Eggerthellaceae bacterium]
MGVMAAAVLVVSMLFCLVPQRSAFAIDLDNITCTARPTASTGSTVYGSDETRVTLRFNADEDQLVNAVTMVFPEGVQFGDAGLRVAWLEGTVANDISVSSSVTGQTLSITFN